MNNNPDTITCLLCNKIMKMINNKHLASHAITASEYKNRFPGESLLSENIAKKLSERSIKSNESRKEISRTDETKQKISISRKKYFETNTPYKGIVSSDEQKRKQSETMKTKYRNGSIKKRIGFNHSEETKQKISGKLKGIPQGSERAYKAIETKKENGFDIAIFRNRKHSDESKEAIGLKSTEYYIKMRPIFREPMIERIKNANLTLLNEIIDDNFLLRCNKCNYEFHRNHQMFDLSRYKITICDQCFPISKTSEAERYIKNMIYEWLPHDRIIGSDMEQISPLELDIYLPDFGLAIEYNGLYRHSESSGKKQWYHRHKFDLCKKKDIKLITIFEDEWVNKKEIVTNILRNNLKLNTIQLNATDCKVVEITSAESSPFLDLYHIRGRDKNTVSYGLVYEDDLVSVMTFIVDSSENWKINRYCKKFNIDVCGGELKIISEFIKEYSPIQITHYSDLRYDEGDVYINLGFELEGYTVPVCWYFKNNEYMRHHTLNDYIGWNRIWDCGYAKWKYKQL